MSEYTEAIDKIKENPFNLGNINPELIDLKMLRFTRRYHPGSGAWALTAYTPKKLKDDIHIWVDNIVDFEAIFGFSDITLI